MLLRPAVKRVHSPFVLPGRRIRIGMEQYGIASEIIDDESGSVERLLGLMDGTRDVTTIWAELRISDPDCSLDDVTDAIQQLDQAGHVEDLGAPLPSGLTKAEVQRYRSCRDYFSWIDTTPRSSPYDIQARIRQARVALLGLGGTGSAVAASLVASGIGALHFADFDCIEDTNLTRQLLYTEADVGRRKIDAAIDRLTALNSTVALTGLDLRVESADDIAQFIHDCDVFVLCADEPADTIQYWANEAALRTSTPWFMAAYTGAMTGVGGFIPGETGCWECVTRRERLVGDDYSAGRWLFDHRPHAVVAASAAVCGHLCALDVLHHIGGMPSQTRGRIFQHNLAKWDHQYFLDATRDPQCPACGNRP